MLPLLLIDCGPAADRHDNGPGHPERPERARAVQLGLEAAGLGDSATEGQARPATRSELLRVHHAGLLDGLQALDRGGGGDLDPDTRVSPGSWEAAVLGAGSGLAAMELLEKGAAASAFVSVRPPGHHAGPDRSMGFCLLNNVAVTAAALAEGGERVLIVDWDVHHGNGTQDIFWDDPRVMYVSTHQWPLFPGTGRPRETGGPGAPGSTLNIPLPPGATGDVARSALDEIVAPAVESFSPTWVLVSAGFDAHRDDPLAGLEWSAGDYADLTRVVSGWAPGPGRLIAFLEGGYDLRALAASVGATVSALAGGSYRPEPATSGGPGRDMVELLAAMPRPNPGAH